MVQPARDQRLPSGITVGEALDRSEKWWNEYRGMIPEQITVLTEERGWVSRTVDGGLLMKVKDHFKDQYVGHILQGAPWDDLDHMEKLAVVRVWHNIVFLQGQDDGRIMVDPDSMKGTVQ